MAAASPVRFVTDGTVTAPVLLLLGAKDRRVPKENGIEYYYALKARGVPTQCLLYPEDNHALDKPATEVDSWVNIALWLQTHAA